MVKHEQKTSASDRDRMERRQAEKMGVTRIARVNKAGAIMRLAALAGLTIGGCASPVVENDLGQGSDHSPIAVGMRWTQAESLLKNRGYSLYRQWQDSRSVHETFHRGDQLIYIRWFGDEAEEVSYGHKIKDRLTLREAWSRVGL